MEIYMNLMLKGRKMKLLLKYFFFVWLYGKLKNKVII